MLSQAQEEKLAEMVATVEQKFPIVLYKDGGSRARKAAEIVLGKTISKVGDTHGVDYWRVGSHTASISGGGCTCADEGAFVQGKKFCKHRIAAMFVVKLEGSPEARLRKLFADSPSDEMTLRVFVLFSMDGNIYRVEGHRYAGSNWVRYERDGFVELTIRQFDEVLFSAGWSMSGRPVKQPSMYMNYFFVRGRGGFSTVDMVNAQAHERGLQKCRFEELEAVKDLVFA